MADHFPIRQWSRTSRTALSILAVLAGCTAAMAQQPSLDALQEKLNKAKREAQQLEDAKREKRRQAEAEQARRREAEQAREREREAEQAREREREAERAREREAEKQRNPIVDESGGVLRDTRTGLLWSQSDNGSDISWDDASRYCSGKGGRYRLPTSSELQGIYGTGGGEKTQCGSHRCDVSPRFRLTSFWLWSSEKNGSSQAWFVNLGNGRRVSIVAGFAYNNRALCVQRP
jgi:hypothetical protein